ncbi:hypothetical protein DCCM_0026 [Desulfocucumis palustris]|uniref:DUF6884 domain-containing protein n=1 Tax=Desulfocucumis palustris TaxID=1898651 RepID=A0A2L2X7A6_9FIRM|nr:DUF6884 domain-containing protein [Desulfocucumis palustris]GBF31842.1 hypothetical protein DCCM_0026 [Desulfocucumis palustris]
MKRLLILSCSARKRPDPAPMRAIERYNGPSFMVLRSYLNKGLSPDPDIFIVSAKYGLIWGNEFINDYDQKMNDERAQELNSSVIGKLKGLGINNYDDIFISVGRDYLKAIAGIELLVSKYKNIIICKGTMGRKLAELINWLYQGESHPGSRKPIYTPKGRSCIKGKEISLTLEQIYEKARLEMLVDRHYSRYRSWYVPIDGERVSPKWLVSKISELPVSRFETEDALRVLAQLGVEVKQIL